MLVNGFASGLLGWCGVGIGGADGVRMGVSAGVGLLKHFFQMSMPIRKMAKAIPIMAAGEVKVQCASVGRIWSSSLNSSLASNSPLYFVLRP